MVSPDGGLARDYLEIDDKRQTTITGEGYADLVLIPRKNVSSPALVIELKYDKDTQAAISQIKKRNYPQQVAEYTGDILLVGINYDKNTKHHECQIERWRKE